MLNFIWSGLIIISITFALAHDIYDELTNSYGNGDLVKASYTPYEGSQNILLHYKNFNIDAKTHALKNHTEIIIPTNDNFPDHWKFIAENQTSKDKKILRVKLIKFDTNNHQLELILPEVHWLKITDITQAAFDMAEFAVKLALGLAGIMALWLGLMQIAEKSGLIFIFVKAIHPLLRWLFPEIPKDHPALGSISLNLAANVLGLGNAATPLGIKAMQHLQELNTKKNEASNSMCMFLALNTSSVQLLPPVTLIAIMGTQVSELIIPIILATLCSTIAAIITAKTYARIKI